MSNTLTLKPSGNRGCTPDQNPWKPKKGALATIVNNSGYIQKLNKIDPGLLAPADHRTITVTKGGWSGHVGHNEGTYEYDDGEAVLAEVGDSIPGVSVRNGTIDPS